VYDAVDDPHCYKGAAILRNRLGLRDQAALDAFEADATAQRFSEPLPGGRFDVRHYRLVHGHIFGDVYPWAGRFRKMRIAKGGSMFCYPEHILTEMQRVFAELSADRYLNGLSADEFAPKAAHFLAELNAIHPFRDGNGRTQLAFLALIAKAAGHALRFERLDPDEFLTAMIESFRGQEASLAKHVMSLIR
jgi:cell filamentation protein